MREVTELKTGWRFRRGALPQAVDPAFDDSDWSRVRVPHDWAIAGPFDPENDIQIDTHLVNGQPTTKKLVGNTGALPHVGQGVYRLRFRLPDDGTQRRYRLEFDGVMSHSRVYCNGREVGAWPYGYSSFAFEISDYIQPGENLLAVTVDNPPRASRWYPGAGIYRHVRLIRLASAHVAHWGVAVTTPDVCDAEAQVLVRTDVDSVATGETAAAAGEPLTLETRILDPDGQCVAAGQESWGDDGLHRVVQRFTVPHPRRWSLDAPTCYRVESSVRRGGLVLDRHETLFGIRTLGFDPVKGFLLNGHAVQMQGVCMHHDLGPLGAAVNRAALARQLRLLQEMGCNAIRTSHNPPAPELLELTDQMGFVVIVEAFDEWRIKKCENGYHRLFAEWAERDLRAMVRRARNHPSVILWSLGNEVSESGSPDGAETARFLHDICKSEDPTRPTTAGIAMADRSLQNGMAAVLDVPGWNYQPESYGRFQRLHPDWPMYGSETASCVSSRGEYHFPAEEARGDQMKHPSLHISSYDLACPNWATLPDAEFRGIDEHPGIMGEFVWTGFDYLGEPTPYRGEWPSRSAYFGIIDLCGLPKDRFYLYQSRWTERPVLHILPHWTWPGREGRTTPVHVYSRFTTVELFLNGRSLGVRTKSRKNLFNRYRLIWNDVSYEPGTLRAVAYDDAHQPVAEAAVRTAGPPAALEATVDRERLTLDGDDMAFVTVRIRDVQGEVCPRASHPVRFSVQGPAEIAAVDNGDPTALASFQSDSVKAFNGACMLYLRATEGAPGPIRVAAESSGLVSAQVQLQGVAPEK